MSNVSISDKSGYIIGAGATMGSDFSTPPYQERPRDKEPYLFKKFPLESRQGHPSWAGFFSPLFYSGIFNSSYGPDANISGVIDDVFSVPEDVTYDFVEMVLGAIMTNGLARTEAALVLEGNVTLQIGNESYVDGRAWPSGKADFFTTDPETSKDWVRLEVFSTVEGLSYNINGFPIKIAVAILTTYIVVATCHFIYTCVSGISSTSWNSISEVTALAMNSPPTEHLQDTCTGIGKLRVFQLPVRILAIEDETEGEEEEGSTRGLEHLHLVFGDVDKEYAARNRIRWNKEYGSLKVD